MPMFESLKRIADSINELIRNDSFPERIAPEYLQRAVRAYPSCAGKRLRPVLMTWCCGLLGGSEKAARYPAAAVEVFHNWTLVHDDIIDDDTIRRNHPCSHIQLAEDLKNTLHLADEKTTATFGRNFAILAGDAQQGWANDLLLRAIGDGVKPEVVIAISRLLQQKANADLISGEALDVELSLRQLDTITPEEVIRMFTLKTGALLEFSAMAGGMIALNQADAGQDPRIQKLQEFTRCLGIAFQLRDDYLGMFGETAKLGKPIGADLREGKATVLLLNALKRLAPSKREELQQLIGREHYTEQEIAFARKLIIDSGANIATEALIDRYVEQARNIIREFPDNEYRECLLELLPYLVDREN